MDYRYHVKPALCIACKSCELACAFTHGSQQGQLGKSRINISVIKEDERHQINTPLLCLQCDAAACATICPSGALRWNEDTRAIELKNEVCVQCRMCVVACPFGNIYFDSVSTYPVKCDLCGGDPRCVKFCPSGAISWVPLRPEEVNTLPVDEQLAEITDR